MKTVLAVLLLAVGAALGGSVVHWYQSQHVDRATPEGEREVLYYRNPMDPTITSPEPRKDHMGMDYIPVYVGAEGEDDPGVVRVAPGVLQNMNVRVAMVEQGSLTRDIRTVGFVDYDERALSHVHVRTGGWIDGLHVRTLGERVDAGQVLFRLYSPALVNAQEELLQIVMRGGNAEAAQERLRALGMSTEEIHAMRQSGQVRQQVSIHARHDGVVQELNVREGMRIEPGTSVMTIADLSRVWVVVDLFEGQVDAVSVGSTAEVVLPFRPAETLQGKVDFIYPTLSSPTRTVRARLVFDNSGQRLKPGMYGDVRLNARPIDDVVHVPAEGVIRTGHQSRVIVALGEGRFEGREVVVGRRAADRLEIVEGLKAGERIVASGHFLIDSESNLAAAMHRMRGDDSFEDAVQDIWSKGRVESLELAQRMIRLAHEPIPQLQWPDMTMDFAVADGLDLAGIERGMPIRFQIVEGGEFGYTVTAIELQDGELREVVPEIWATAEVNAVDITAREVNVTHAPIPELSWPAMTMDFSVADGVHLDALESGMSIRVRVVEGGELGYTITAIEPPAE